MPYPMLPAFKVKELVKTLVEKHDCKEGCLEDGTKFLERKAEGKHLRVPIDLPEDITCAPLVALDIIRNLRIEPKEFGFDLDKLLD